MSPVTREDFAPEQGLFDDSNGTITNAWFGPSEKYVTSTGETPDLLNIVIEDEALEKPAEQGYSMGPAMLWQPNADRSEVNSGKKPTSHAWMKNSRAYELVEAIFKTIGNGDIAKGQEALIPRGFYMTQAGFYVGLSFHWKRVKKPQVTGGESDVLLPDVFLGFVNTTVPSPVSHETNTPAKTPIANLDGQHIDMVIAMAQGKDERGLKMAIMSHPTLKADSALTNKVFNQGFLKDLVQQGKLALGPDGKFI